MMLTENSIILLKMWRRDFRKEEFCHIYQQCFYLKELTQIEWSITQNKTMEELMKQKLKIMKIKLVTILNLIQTQNLDFVRMSFN